MNRASPADLRKALEVAHELSNAGILFVCMPVQNEIDFIDLVNEASERLETMATDIEAQP